MNNVIKVTNLVELRDALNHKRNLAHLLATPGILPTFGGTEPVGVLGVVSYDATHILFRPSGMTTTTGCYILPRKPGGGS